MTEQNKKYATYVAGGLAAILLFKVLVPKTDTSGGASDPTGNGNAGGSQAPVATFDAATVANKLYNAMKNTGTNEDLIMTTLTPVSAQQFAQVITAFGKKPYNIQLGNEWALPFIPNPKHGLIKWLEVELSEDDYNILALKYPQL